MFHKILVPLDGSELAEGILPYVSQLAKGMNVPLLILSVVDPNAIDLPSAPAQGGPWIEGMGEQGPVNVRAPIHGVEEHSRYPHATGGPNATQVFERMQIEAKKRLGEVVKRLSEQGLQPHALVEVGHPAEEIVRVAEREGCDLIAMSTHGRGILGRGILGSVTDKVLHSSHVPTLTITPDKAKNYWQESAEILKIMVPLDGSVLAESVLPYVEDLAQKLSLEVVLIRAVKFDGFYSADVSGYLATRVPDLEARLETEAIEYLKRMCAKLAATGLGVGWKLLRGKPDLCIVELAQETRHDLIALTTHGRSGLTRWITGSVAESLVRASGDPILIVPPQPG